MGSFFVYQHYSVTSILQVVTPISILKNVIFVPHCSIALHLSSFESLRLPLAKGSSTSNQAFLLRRKDVTALLGARNRYAMRLSDHQRSSPGLRDGTAFLLSC